KPGSRGLDQRRQQRDKNDRQYHQREVALNHRNVAEQISRGDEKSDPEKAPQNAEDEKARVIHPPDAGDERRKSADDGHEARDDHRLDAVSLVKFARTVEVLAVEPARAFAVEDFRPDNIA